MSAAASRVDFAGAENLKHIMLKRDYRKEVGIDSGRKDVPRSVAILVLAVLAIVVSFSAKHLLDEGARRHAATAPAPEATVSAAEAVPAAAPAKAD